MQDKNMGIKPAYDILGQPDISPGSEFLAT
jgi:hypothetical protein